MASTPATHTLKKIGAIYSWLFKQPQDVVNSINSVSEAEILYDAHLSAIASQPILPVVSSIKVAAGKARGVPLAV